MHSFMQLEMLLGKVLSLLGAVQTMRTFRLSHKDPWIGTGSQRISQTLSAARTSFLAGEHPRRGRFAARPLLRLSWGVLQPLPRDLGCPGNVGWLPLRTVHSTAPSPCLRPQGTHARVHTACTCVQRPLDSMDSSVLHTHEAFLGLQ